VYIFQEVSPQKFLKHSSSPPSQPNAKPAQASQMLLSFEFITDQTTNSLASNLSSLYLDAITPVNLNVLYTLHFSMLRAEPRT